MIQMAVDVILLRVFKTEKSPTEGSYHSLEVWEQPSSGFWLEFPVCTKQSEQ